MKAVGLLEEFVKHPGVRPLARELAELERLRDFPPPVAISALLMAAYALLLTTCEPQPSAAEARALLIILMGRLDLVPSSEVPE